MRTAVLFFATGLFALGCEGLIGANFDHRDGDGAVADVGVDGEGTDGAALVDGANPGTDGAIADGGGSDGGAGFVPVCGDMSPYDPGSLWPMGAYCPTRPNRTKAPALKKPHVLWRYDYASPNSGLEYTAGPAIAADGTVIVPGYFGYDGGFVNAVSGIKNKVEVFHSPLPGNTCNTPTIDKSGNFYVRCTNALAAFTKTGAQLWTLPLATGNTDMPVLLGDGTIVVLDGPQMVFITPLGVKKFAYSLGEAGLIPSFVGSIAVSTTGVLYAAAAGKAGDLNGSLHAVDSSGQMVSSPSTLDGAPTS